MWKFVDSLPGLSADGGVTGANNLGQYIPVAVADTTTYPGCDYYQIGIADYTKQVHTDLPKATKFRGYVDLGTGSTPAPQYLGPVIVAQRDRPVRIKVTNQLGAGTAGNLFLPVDTTLMGAGTGPLVPPEVITPRTASPSITMGPLRPGSVMGRRTSGLPPPEKHDFLSQGREFPKRPRHGRNPGSRGQQTLYYTNQQSGRLMFYHEHAVGITRLNVYAGMAAGYLIHDPVEDDLIDGTNIIGINPGPLKSFLIRAGGLQMGYSFNHPGQNLRTPRRGHRPGYQVEFSLGGIRRSLFPPHL